LTGLFKINNRSLDQLRRNITNDVGNRTRDEMKFEFEQLPSYYYSDSDKKDSIVYDSTAKIVGSEKWAVAASDTGGDWTWRKPPPFNKILEWVVKHSGITGKREQRTAAAGIRKKIHREGIESHYWVDRYLADFTHQAGATGSGIE
jgi:hypothetical protein